MFNWCIKRDYLEDNPTKGIDPPAKERSRERVLSHEELRLVWEAAGVEGYPWGAMVQMLILTGQRLEEVSASGWSEINLDRGIWELPGRRTKNGRPHIVHLSTAAVKILREIPRIDSSGWVFTTTGAGPVKGFSKAKRRLDNACKVSGWTFHDLRRSFATHITQALGVSPVVTDRLLNHASGAVRGIAAVYQRGEYLEQRQWAMEAWGAFIENGPKSSDGVIQFKRADQQE
jgi:integrase